MSEVFLCVCSVAALLIMSNRVKIIVSTAMNLVSIITIADCVRKNASIDLVFYSCSSSLTLFAIGSFIFWWNTINWRCCTHTHTSNVKHKFHSTKYQPNPKQTKFANITKNDNETTIRNRIYFMAIHRFDLQYWTRFARTNYTAQSLSEVWMDSRMANLENFEWIPLTNNIGI